MRTIKVRASSLLILVTMVLLTLIYLFYLSLFDKPNPFKEMVDNLQYEEQSAEQIIEQQDGYYCDGSYDISGQTVGDVSEDALWSDESWLVA